MKKQLLTACLYTIITAVVLGLIYPLVITGLAQSILRDKANGSLLTRKGVVVGSSLIGQAFSGPGYFHSRPSFAGTGYDASASSGSNLGPTSKTLITRVNGSVSAESAGVPVPVDLVTASGSGLDPDVTPAAALYQIPRLARERHFDEGKLRALVASHTTQRQFGLLGEPRVNVLSLNLALDDMAPR